MSVRAANSNGAIHALARRATIRYHDKDLYLCCGSIVVHNLQNVLEQTTALMSQDVPWTVRIQGAPIKALHALSARFAQARTQQGWEHWHTWAWRRDVLDHMIAQATAQLPSVHTHAQNITRTDEAVLAHMWRHKWLPVLPTVVAMTEGDVLNTSSQVLLNGAGGGRIALNSLSTGHVRMFPAASGAQQDVLQRWMVLLHEASHCVFDTLPQPFQPTTLPHRFSQNHRDMLNTWSFGPLFRAPARAMLSENFADVYGAMMLLEELNHSDESVAAVHTMQQWRHHMRVLDDAETNMAILYEGCGTALQLLLDSRASWRGQSPEKLQKLAAQYASDALVLAAEQDAYDTRWHMMFPEDLTLDCVAAAYSDARETKTQDVLFAQWTQDFSTHPAWNSVLHMVDWMHTTMTPHGNHANDQTQISKQQHINSVDQWARTHWTQQGAATAQVFSGAQQELMTVLVDTPYVCFVDQLQRMRSNNNTPPSPHSAAPR